MSLGQTNASGGNTSELEIAVANLTSMTTSLSANMIELNSRMNEIEVATKKWYVNIKPLPTGSASSGGITI